MVLTSAMAHPHHGAQHTQDYGLGRAEVWRGSDAGEVYPRDRGCGAAPGTLCPFEWTKCTGLRDTGASELLLNYCSTRLGERRQTGRLALPRLLLQGPGSGL